MKLHAIQGDITKMEVDAIVNAANSAMIIGGGVDGAIHAAAGPELIEFNALHHGFGCPTGQVKVTPGFNLPAQFILHTVGPDMRMYTPYPYADTHPRSQVGEYLGDNLLRACYCNCMKIAVEEGLKSIAFPSISTGVYGFNKIRAAYIAVEMMYDFYQEIDIDVTFVCFSEEDLAIIQHEIARRDEQEHYLTWSMYLDTSADDSDDWVLDLDAPMPDGVYKVYTYWCSEEDYGEANGVTIENGMFVLEPTLRACAIARNGSGYHGTFLEGLDWNKDKEMFEAQFGS